MVRFINIARRVLVIFLLFFKLSSTSVISFIVLMYAQILYTIFIGFTRPYLEKFDDQIEFFNESLALYMLLCMQLLNDSRYEIH